MLRARRISPRDSRRSGMPLNVYGWCEVVFLESHSRRGSPLYTAPQILLRGPTRPFAEVVRFDCSRGSVK